MNYEIESIKLDLAELNLEPDLFRNELAQHLKLTD